MLVAEGDAVVDVVADRSHTAPPARRVSGQGARGVRKPVGVAVMAAHQARRPRRPSPGYVFLVDGVPYPADCGPRVAGQLVAAGVSLRSIRKIFITHRYNDQDVEYGNVANLA